MAEKLPCVDHVTLKERAVGKIIFITYNVTGKLGQEYTEYLKELKTEHDSTNSSHTIRKGSHPLFTYTNTNTHN